MQSCVSNLILNKRYLNYHQYLADAVSFAEGMGWLVWYLHPCHRLEQ